MTDKYRDIRQLGRPLPCRPRMPRQNRAKLFAPYDALKSFESTVHSGERIYVQPAELSEYAQECLDRTLRLLRRGDTASITWFRPGGPNCPAGWGTYAQNSGRVVRIDPVHRYLYLGTQVIPIPNILCVQTDMRSGGKKG